MSLTPLPDTDYYLLKYLSWKDIINIIRINMYYHNWISNELWMKQLKNINPSKAHNFLYEAAKHGYFTLLKMYFNTKFTSESFYKFNIDRALIYAAYHGRLEIVKYLISIGADAKCGTKTCFDSRISELTEDVMFYPYLGTDCGTDCALTFAAFNNHIEIVKFIVDNGSYMDPTEALWSAISKGNMKMVKYLLSKNAHVPKKNDFAITTTIANGHLEILKLLITNTNEIESGSDYLVEAIRNNHLSVVKYLVDVAEHKLQFQEYGFKYLETATRKNHLDMVKYLVDYGIDPHQNHNKCLRIAVKLHYVEIMNYFMDKIQEQVNL